MFSMHDRTCPYYTHCVGIYKCSRLSTYFNFKGDLQVFTYCCKAGMIIKEYTVSMHKT